MTPPHEMYILQVQKGCPAVAFELNSALATVECGLLCQWVITSYLA